MLQNFLQKNRKILTTALLFLIILSLSGTHVAHAQVNAALCAAGITASCATLAANVASGPSIFSGFLMIPLRITSLILWVGGWGLNFVLNYTVTNLSSHISGISGIDIAWSVIRDLMNMTFIFVLLYIAISTTLGLSGAQWKKTLVSVVVAAILINFSMFFAKVVIDASNVVTLGFYNQIAPTATAGKDGGISNLIMQPLNLTTIYNANNGTAVANIISDTGTMAVVSLGGSIFMIVTAFVFLAIAIMFLVRYVTFIFLLILSPIAVMGSVLPKIAGESKKWWKQLIDQAIFAPLFMIMMWVVIQIISSKGFICTGNLSAIFTNGSSATSLATTACSGGAMGVIMNFVIVISLVIGTLVISREVASQAGSAGQKIVGGALGLGAGGLGYAGRRTIGSFARGRADSENLKDRAANVDGKYSALSQISARAQLKVAQKTAAGSFDARSSRFAGMGKALGMGDLGIDGKAGGKGGYDAYLKDNAERVKKFGESLKPSDILVDQAKAERDKYKKGSDAYNRAQEEVDRLSGVSPDEVNKRKNKLDEEMRAEITNHASVAQVAATEQELKKREAELQSNLILPESIKAERAAELTKKREELELAKQAAATAEADIKKKYADQKAAIKEIKGVGKDRTEGYAKVITESGPISINRVGLIGMQKRHLKQAAAILRKGQKPLKDQIDDILKAGGEAPKKDDAGEEKKEGGEASASEPKPAGGDKK